jgi:hypothetical protein
MSAVVARRSSDAMLRIARYVTLLILLFAMVGILAELLLIEHFEDAWQIVPLALLAIGFGAIAWHARAPGTWSVRTLRSVMTLFVLAGLLGIFLHSRGNVEFELEQNPGATRWGLFREAMQGATPALAPGVMVQIGLLGLLYAFLTSTAKMADLRIQNSEFRAEKSEI